MGYLRKILIGWLGVDLCGLISSNLLKESFYICVCICFNMNMDMLVPIIQSNFPIFAKFL